MSQKINKELYLHPDNAVPEVLAEATLYQMKVYTNPYIKKGYAIIVDPKRLYDALKEEDLDLLDAVLAICYNIDTEEVKGGKNARM